MGIAFLLGYFSRVARKELELIVKTIFGKAYGLAYPPEIVPERVKLRPGQSYMFQVSPNTQVAWQASAGNITDGAYQAPAAGTTGQIVKITAVPADTNLPTAVAQVEIQ